MVLTTPESASKNLNNNLIIVDFPVERRPTIKLKCVDFFKGKFIKFGHRATQF
jgi:hypothetical protein